MWYVRDVLYAVLYVRVTCFVVRGCGVNMNITIDDISDSDKLLNCVYRLLTGDHGRSYMRSLRD